MAKKRMGRPVVEYVIRTIEVKTVRMYVSHRIDDRRYSCTPGDAWLQVRGTTDEPINGQSDVEISIQERDRDEKTVRDTTKSIGALIQLQPQAQIVVDMPPRLFDRTWTMAAGGQLRHVWISMTKPKGKFAPVVSVSFQNEPIE